MAGNTPVKHGKRWRIRWIDAAGNRCSEVYDTYDDALYKVREHELEAQQIKRGLRVPLRRTRQNLQRPIRLLD